MTSITPIGKSGTNFEGNPSRKEPESKIESPKIQRMINTVTHITRSSVAKNLGRNFDATA